MIRIRRRYAAAAACLLFVQAAPAAAQTAAVEGGTVAGRTEGDVSFFKGIPFAAPPVGNLRWRAPQPVQSWKGVRQAAQFGPDCMQWPFPSDAAPLGTESAEDCLTLNVWRPSADAGKPMPVLVWIYGGGFTNGGSSPAVYDGAAMARNGLVVVSFNYRLGRFGYFAHPALSAAKEGPLGNYGVLDQIAALKWIKRNIAAFGGDPSQVTVMGESAGGNSILNIMASPAAMAASGSDMPRSAASVGAQQLFQRAIIMSGGGRKLVGNAPLTGDTPQSQSAETIGTAFAQSVGIRGDGPEALAALRALPATEVRGNFNMSAIFTGTPLAAFGPIIDGQTVVGSTEQALRSGAMMHVPVLVGTTDGDVGFLQANTKEELFAQFGDSADAIRAAYDPEGTGEVKDVVSAAGRDQLMDEPARFVATQTVGASQPAWLYRFSYVAKSMRSEWQSAPHATDIPFALDTVAAKYGSKLDPEDRKASRLFSSYLANFAKTGDPNGAGLPRWAPFDPAADNLLILKPDATAATVADPHRKRLDAMQRVADAR